MAQTNTLETGAVENSSTSSKRLLLLSLVLCVIGACAGFFAQSGRALPFVGKASATGKIEKTSQIQPEIAFVEIPTLIVTLPPNAKNNHLRFTALIEVPLDHQEDVEFLIPRIQDILNGYLRALTAEDIEGPGALFKIRLHLFRRIAMVVGLGKANSLLVTEFILN
ncbi:flagellar basal body-associated FliL family protein [uncultured Marivita sp.]|nr:flagellar basal body-associated FliL family protein [Marivita sp. XM-24bin2]